MKPRGGDLALATSRWGGGVGIRQPAGLGWAWWALGVFGYLCKARSCRAPVWVCRVGRMSGGAVFEPLPVGRAQPAWKHVPKLRKLLPWVPGGCGLCAPCGSSFRYHPSLWGAGQEVSACAGFLSRFVTKDIWILLVVITVKLCSSTCTRTPGKSIFL